MNNESNGYGRSNDSQLENTINGLLDGRSDRFKATVLEIVRQNGWKDNDPAFVLLVATGQMEALLRQYPSEFAVLLTGILEDAEVRWAKLQQEWIASVGMASETSQQFVEQIDELKAATREQIALMEAEAETLIAKGFALSQAHTVKQIESISKGTQKTHYVQALGYSLLAAAALTALSWTGGWLGRGWLEQASTWGDIERWNGDELQACLSAGRKTCNFHIEAPEEAE